MAKILTEDLATRKMLDRIFDFDSRKLNEDEQHPLSDVMDSDTKSNEIPINDSTFPGILENQKETLSQKLPNVTFEENPFILNKNNDTVTLKGKIQNLNLDFIRSIHFNFFWIIFIQCFILFYHINFCQILKKFRFRETPQFPKIFQLT